MGTAAVDFERVVEECRTGGLNEENIARLAKTVAETFGVRPQEVGILRVEGPWLVFLHPTKLRNLAAIPLNAANSVAAQTATNGRPQIINNFAQVKHTTIFESIPLEESQEDRSTAVIQKLISVPIPGAKGPLGVLQVCRKGATPKAAGTDFSFLELQRLMSKASVLAKLMAA
ncbi:MAG TPA: hypothetical protein VE998_11045 [Terriglobales bacterium]|nr:hypothetical protein [Terriglobales bacterium]